MVLFRYWLLIFLWVLQTAPVAADSTDKHPHPIKLPNNSCSSCHTQDSSFIKAIVDDQSKCTTCHALKETAKSKTLQTAQAQQDILNLKQHAVVPKEKLPADSGMRFPIYYKSSRLGDAPNEMVLIPAGEFIMGSDNRLPDEGPQHKVSLDAFFIDIYEVTNLQYKKFNDATKRRSPTHFRNRTFPEGKADHPVTYVSWEDADAYCQWAGKRLPTDQEWEKAARGTDGRIFPWGNEFDAKNANTPLRWQQVGAFGDTTPVGAFEGGVSPYGVYDMSGNVWEWTASWYKAYPDNKVPSESYGERYKTLKGGSWFDCSFYNCGISAPVFNRAFFAIRTKNDSFGFRCAKNADARR
ncbi:formylglycine-generating enzyme family protein [Kaarinaea lacus]